MGPPKERTCKDAVSENRSSKTVTKSETSGDEKEIVKAAKSKTKSHEPKKGLDKPPIKASDPALSAISQNDSVANSDIASDNHEDRAAKRRRVTESNNTPVADKPSLQTPVHKGTKPLRDKKAGSGQATECLGLVRAASSARAPLVAGASQSEESGMPSICLRCAKEWSRFPSLVCYVPEGNSKCMDCKRKNGACTPVPSKLMVKNGIYEQLFNAVKRFEKGELSREELEKVQVSFTKQAERMEIENRQFAARCIENPALESIIAMNEMTNKLVTAIREQTSELQKLRDVLAKMAG